MDMVLMLSVHQASLIQGHSKYRWYCTSCQHEGTVIDIAGACMCCLYFCFHCRFVPPPYTAFQESPRPLS